MERAAAELYVESHTKMRGPIETAATRAQRSINSARWRQLAILHMSRKYMTVV
jgi:hypothetical protein